MRHTIFTPVYNRSTKLLECYEHMKALKYQRDEFEWLIIDDGSTDDLNAAIDFMKNENLINIRVIHHDKNRGIQAARNSAIKNAQGTFVTLIDSDDYLLPDALQIKDRYWNSIPEEQKDKFVGVVGIVLHKPIDPNQEPTEPRSSLFGREITDTTGLQAQKEYKAIGDRNFCMRTEVMQKYTLPEYDDTHWIPEGPIWRMIDKSYLTRFIDIPISVASSNEADSVTNMKDKRMSKKIAMSCAYGHLLLMNLCPETETFIKRRKHIISFVAFAKAAGKENGSYKKIISLLKRKYHRFLAFLYFPIIAFSAKRLKRRIK